MWLLVTLFPLVFQSWFGTDFLQLVLVEVGEGVDDHPWERSAEVDDLVHEEAHEAGRESVILHPQIPRLVSSNVSYPCSCFVPTFWVGW